MDLSSLHGVEYSNKDGKCYTRNCGSNLSFQQGFRFHRFHLRDLESRYRFTGGPVPLRCHCLHPQLQALSRQPGIRPDPY
jgi:hypothetical protein